MDEIFNISFAPFFIIADDYAHAGKLWSLSGSFEVFEVDEQPKWDIINSLN